MTIEIESLEQEPGVAVYGALTEAQLRNRLEPERGVFIAESPKVIAMALDAGYEAVSLLCERRHIEGDAAPIIARLPDAVPVYTGERPVLARLTGYTLTRGVLCAMRRRPLPGVEQVCRGARRLVVVHGVCDTTNVGAIFRSAAALGVDGVLLSPDACDPLNRRAARVSMGTVFAVPWTRLPGGLEQLHSLGFATLAMALHRDALTLDDPRLKALPRLALVMGTEGDGLPQDVIDSATHVVTIPMARGIDSLNVAAATAVACWQLRP
ncbi:MAG: RNA methyltransferase [Muribaculaceae bacterium]|nr:RNA methyltransferase [Muribaculaceae bacterium]